MYEVIFYDTEDGKTPVKEYLDSLDGKIKAKTFHTIDLLEKFGTELRMPYSRYMGEGIFELRTKQGTNITRIMYFFFVGKRIILTNGFTKKTEKTPNSFIQEARRYREDYLRRNKNE